MVNDALGQKLNCSPVYLQPSCRHASIPRIDADACAHIHCFDSKHMGIYRKSYESIQFISMSI